MLTDKSALQGIKQLFIYICFLPFCGQIGLLLVPAYNVFPKIHQIRELKIQFSKSNRIISGDNTKETKPD